ncbi:MAG: restriction endonuclease subunit M/S [Betaproteobacteria bacterium]|nr:MAG: restriction endonuclease subunit M/S [Betaproteobacteria bacterium]
MLDTDTKRRIDTARDILVGKVPDPKSQVEQITIALIYKFMDDMDAESEELGGKRSFFTGDFARYGWAKLMNPGLGGHEMLGLYGEGISKMPENPGIPALFRDIFKNAYLPYRDPETLKAFLKIIDEFSYDHSERLGDAFEYLLSVLGSQGDAGQFRTPRHIIDFMVDVVAPQKNEVILDPACGTAGFLISAYKHIVRSNTDGKGNSTLTPDDKGRMAKNFKGYDISPDMVRLSLVNLYLHGFTDPHIYEYDTLTSEERWNESADVILANPPFMSPKGGIKPHKRFSIQAKRSEVLFVDYIAEHLTPTGRAGIIVPEGIIFQSQTAYKELRKMLVNQSLVAVISLPAGCFNPYSGVKTSILILDKSLAKQADSVAFFKIENDGYGLGAQRRAVANSDLPQVKKELDEYLSALRQRRSVSDLAPTCGLIVTKEKLAANGEFNLSGERYREGIVTISTFPHALLRDVSDIITKGTTPTTAGFSFEDTGVNFIKIESVAEDGKIIASKVAHISNEAHAALARSQLAAGDVLFSIAGAMGRSASVDSSLLPANTNQALAIIRGKQELISPFYLSHLLRSARILAHIESVKAGVAQYNVSLQQVGDIQIPLPPLDVQKEIVAEIEGYQKVIDGARAVLDHYRPNIPIKPDWPMIALGDACTIRSGGTPSRGNPDFWNGSIPWVTTTLINYGSIRTANEFITEDGLSNSSTWIVPKGTVLMAMYGEGVTRGRVAILGIDAAINQACAAFVLKTESLLPAYLYLVLQSRYEDLRSISEARGGNQSNLSAQVLKAYAIPVPPIATQQAIVAEIEAEQALVNGNRELITRFEKKIQTTLARVWGEV